MKNKFLVLYVIVLSLFGMAMLPNNTYAETVCETAQLSAVASLPVGMYDLYVKNEQFAPNATVNIAAQNIDNQNCVNAAPEPVAGTVFRKVGYLASTGLEPLALYITTNSELAISTGDLYIVARGTTPCDMLQTACVVNYENQQLILEPQKISFSSDMLKVGLLQDITSDSVMRVAYFVDGKQVYETKLLETFNEKYVPAGEHTITRRVYLKSGQTLHDTKTIDRGTAADILKTFQAYFYRSSVPIKIVGSILLLFLFAWLLHAVVRTIAKKRVYQETHDVRYVQKLDKTKLGAQKVFYDESLLRLLYRYRRWWGGFIVISCAVLVVMSYVVSVFTVDGVSMFPTLQDKSHHWLLRFPRTYATIARNDYIPKRGTIVVVNKSEDNAFSQDAQATEPNFVVKRVVGLPNERITVKDGIIKVYNQEKPDGFVPDDEYKWIQDLSGSEYFNIDITLMDGEVFVVGDNRDESIDSRFYGPIAAHKVVGSVK